MSMANQNIKVKYTYSLVYIVLTLLMIGITVWMLQYTLNGLKEVEQIRHPSTQQNVIWQYSCPDYVQDYFNCNTTRFMNMTGKYCGERLVCENKYEVLK